MAVTSIPLFLSIGLGLGFSYLGRGLNWVALSVIRAHVSYPIIQISRLIAGTPSWLPIDLTIGRFPDGKRQRAAAAALGYVEETVCGCGEPTCENANVKTWIHRDALANARKLQAMARTMAMNTPGQVTFSVSPVDPADPADPADDRVPPPAA